MDHAVVLDICARADPDDVDVAAYGTAEPDSRFGADNGVADNTRPRRDKGRRVDFRQDIPIGEDQCGALLRHGFFLVSRPLAFQPLP